MFVETADQVGLSFVVMLSAVTMQMKLVWGLLIPWMLVRKHVEVEMAARILFTGKGVKLDDAGMKESPKAPAPLGRTMNMTSTGSALVPWRVK